MITINNLILILLVLKFSLHLTKYFQFESKEIDRASALKQLQLFCLSSSPNATFSDKKPKCDRITFL